MLASGLCRLGLDGELLGVGQDVHERSCLLSAAVLSAPVSSDLFFPKTKSDLRDTPTETFTTLATLRTLQVVSSSWVYISSNDDVKRAVRIFAIDPQALALQGLSEGQIHISPCLHFNLGIQPGDKVQVTTLGLHQRVASVSKDAPKVAARVTIARVRCPSSSGHVGYGKALRNFFRVPRVLARGDIVAVPMRKRLCLDSPAEGEGEDSYIGAGEPVEDEDILDEESFVPRPSALVYFQVTDLQSEDSGYVDEEEDTGMLIDGVGGQTMMTQAGAVNTHVPDPDSIQGFLDAEVELHESKTSGNLYEIDTKHSQRNDRAERVALLKAEYKEALNRLVSPKLSSYSGSGLSVGAAVLVYGPKGTGKRVLVNAIAQRYGVHVKEVSLTALRGLPGDRASKRLRQIMGDAMQVAPCILHLRNLHALAPLANGSEAPEDPDQVSSVIKEFVDKFTGMQRFIYGENASNDEASEKPVFIVASTQVIDETPALLRGCFTHEIQIEAPDKSQRLAILEFLSSSLKTSFAADVSLETIATKTAGRTTLELRQLLANAGCVMIERVTSDPNQNTSAALTMTDLEHAIDNLPSTAMDIGAPKIPSVYWKDVGGLSHAKDEIMDMVQLPLEHPELFASGVRQRSGLLLYGPPGTGKTLIAKAVATECSLNFISVKGPELLDMYIGESERKVRQVFETARSAKPCVLFFDELDSLAPQRGRGADSGGVMDRVVSQLLTEIDGMQGNTDVFVIGATNRPDLLDQSLLRPGRFDRLIYLGISSDREAQMKILKAITRKYVHEDDVDFDQLLEQCGDRFTGADFAGLCSGAMAFALKRRVQALQDDIAKRNENIVEDYKKWTPRKLLTELGEDDLVVKVSMVDYLKSLETTVPSVSAEELEHYEQLRQKFSSS